MKAFILLALCVSSFAVDIDQIFTIHQQQQLAQIKDTQWGRWMLDFAEIHLSTGGLLSQLLESMEKVIQDLTTELASLDQGFFRRTGEHNQEVAKLTQSIEDADRDLFNAQDLIDNVLIPQRTRISQTLRQLKSNIEENRKNLNQETKQRANDHAAFEARSTEHTEAIAAIDECLELLLTITNPSLIQVKKVQAHIENLHNKLKDHSVFSPLVRALLQLATEQNFANQESLQTIVTAFNKLRVELVNSLNQEIADENNFQKEFEARVVQLNKEHAEFQRQVLLRNAELVRTEEKLQSTGEYIQQRKSDKATLVGQLTAENDNYARESDTYYNLNAEYKKELDAAKQAYAIVSEPTFVEYVNNLVGK